jgi:hypothetical protein
MGNKNGNPKNKAGRRFRGARCKFGRCGFENVPFPSIPLVLLPAGLSGDRRVLHVFSEGPPVSGCVGAAAHPHASVAVRIGGAPVNKFILSHTPMYTPDVYYSYCTYEG